MNINAISSNTFGANNVLKPVEDYSSIIRYNNENVCDYVRETIDGKWATIGEYAKRHNTKVFIEQRGDELLVNSGALTERFNFMKCSADKFVDNITANIRKNSHIKENNTTIKKTLDLIWKDAKGLPKIKFRTLIRK